MGRKRPPAAILFACGLVTIVLGGVVIAGVAMRSTSGKQGSTVALRDSSRAQSKIVCPDVAGRLPAVPAAAQAEVNRNLAQLQTQINEANRRLATSAGEGGPNFVQNAILGPLKDKRAAALERITIAIGRVAARPAGLQALAACSLSNGGGAAAPTAPPAATAPATTAPPAQQPPAAQPPAGNGNGNAGGNGNGNGGGSASIGQIVCPDVASELPLIPAAAEAEVERNLAQLQTQQDEANRRLVTSVGQGGPNFVQNAILGPLKDKRVAAIQRIEIAIGRVAARPTGLEALAPCQVVN